MKLAYGYSLTGDDDPFLQVAGELSKISGWALAPGRWLVDYYPIRKRASPLFQELLMVSNPQSASFLSGSLEPRGNNKV